MRNRMFQAMLVFLLLPVAVGASAGEAPVDRACEVGKGIERVLGNHGYRVVMGGGYALSEGRPVKVQVWENEDRDWVITEAFLRQRKTCVVRTGIRLHSLY